MGSMGQGPGRHPWPPELPAPPHPYPGSCAKTTGSCLRTSYCRSESSQSSGRTWVRLQLGGVGGQ